MTSSTSRRPDFTMKRLLPLALLAAALATPAAFAESKAPAPADEKAVPDCCKIEPATQPAAPTTQPVEKSAAKPVPAPAPPPARPAPKSDAKSGATTKPAAKNSRVSPWTEPADRTTFSLDYEMIDQDGNPVKLASFANKPTAVSFFFTRCANPQMCPLVAFTMGNLQRDLAKAGLADKANCVLISYDPIFDTPDRMKQFGKERGFDFKQGVMLAPKPADFRAWATDWELAFAINSDGSINHKMELMMFDKHGKFVRLYHGEIWQNADVLKDLQRLASEP